MDFHAYLINDGDKRNCWVRMRGRASVNRIPLHLIACIDTSGSMGEEMRLENVKHTLRTVVDFMTPADKLSLISFSTGSEVLTRQMPVTDAAKKEQIKHQVGGLVATGGTNLSAGLINVLSCIDTTAGPATKQVLLLLTDGHTNRGLVEAGQIEQLIRQALVAAPALTVVTMGYGSSHNVEMMRTAATAGNGTYSAVASLEDVATTFGETFGNMVTTVAQNIMVRIPEGATYVGSLPVHNGCVVVGDIGTDAEVSFLMRLGPLGDDDDEDAIYMAMTYYDCVDMMAMANVAISMQDGAEYVDDLRLYVLRQDVSAFLLKHAGMRRLPAEERATALAEADGLVARCIGDHGLVGVLRSDLVACRARIVGEVVFSELERAQATQNATFFGLGRGVYSQWSAAEAMSDGFGEAHVSALPPGGSPALFHTFSSPTARQVSGGVVRAVTGAPMDVPIFGGSPPVNTIS